MFWEFLLGGENNISKAEQLPGWVSNIMENIRFGRFGALPRTLAIDLYPLPAPPPRPPEMRAGNLLAQPIGPNRIVHRAHQVPQF